MNSSPAKVSDSMPCRGPRPARRGDLITIVLSGDFRKPRSALILQVDQFAGTATVTVPLISSTLVEAPLLRVTVHPNPENSLQNASQVMVDKTMIVKREKLGRAFGHIDSDRLLEIERCLAVFRNRPVLAA